ncbi:MAG TPA: hypothetical protein VME67_12640 [Mycobacterium sp.]|nr:hypothetical protein [Mycobacterium sp.]HTX95614.1 hypothetical protein [Mycobacterium sp.]
MPLQDWIKLVSVGPGLRAVLEDWMLEEWCGTAPDRYVPLRIRPLWDVEAD